jgi:hypothetical protein
MLVPTVRALDKAAVDVAPLLDSIRARGIQPETVAADKGYDSTRVYAEI